MGRVDTLSNAVHAIHARSRSIHDVSQLRHEHHGTARLGCLPIELEHRANLRDLVAGEAGVVDLAALVNNESHYVGAHQADVIIVPLM